MARTRIAAALAVSLSMGLLFAGASSAQAEDVDTCTTPVVDLTSDHMLDTATVEAAVDQANATGADFYVRAFESTPGGSLDAYWQESIKDCANWRSGNAENGVPKGNIIMVAFGMDRQSAIFYGSGFNETIGVNRANDLRADMNEQFRAGNFTDGVVTAVDELAVLADPNRPIEEPEAAPAAPEFKVDWAGFWTVTLWVVAGLACVGLLIWVFFLNQSRLRRVAGRARLAEAKRKAGEKVVAWDDPGEFLDVTFLTGGEQLPKEVQSVDYTVELMEIDRRAGSAAVLNRNYGSSKSHDPQNKRLDEKELKQAHEDYTAIARAYDAAHIALASLKAKAAEDVRRYSFEGQAARASAIRKTLSAMAGKLSDYGQMFATTIVSRKHQRLSSELMSIDEALRAKAGQLDTYERLEKLDSEVSELGSEFGKMDAAASSLTDPRGTLQEILKRGRGRLQRLDINTEKEERKLATLDGSALDGVLRKLNASNSYERQMSVFDAFERRVSTVVAQAQARDDAYRAEQEKRRRKERERQRREEQRRSSYSSSSSSDGFFGGMVGGYIGASLGSSHSSSSSSSSSSFDFGGGSSGGWGGGGDSGGGSSGSW